MCLIPLGAKKLDTLTQVREQRTKKTLDIDAVNRRGEKKKTAKAPPPLPLPVLHRTRPESVSGVLGTKEIRDTTVDYIYLPDSGISAELWVSLWLPDRYRSPSASVLYRKVSWSPQVKSASSDTRVSCRS